MKTVLPYTMVLLLALGCSHTMPQQGPEVPLVARFAPARQENATAYESAAWKLFRSADYVRALSFAYQAAEIRPQGPSAALLVALIYDHGFNRPDLALSAYNHILHKASAYEGVHILQPRLPYLFRRTQERIAQISITHPEGAPLQGSPLALFPILPWSQDKTDAAFSLGLTDILFSRLLDIDSKLPALRSHLLAHAFLEAFPDADAKAFAQWAGAEQTLSGTLVRGNDHHISVTLSLLNSKGQTVRIFSPIPGNMGALDALREAVLLEVTQVLKRATPGMKAPMPSSLALTLYGQGLDAYMAADVAQARAYFAGAVNLAPGTERISRMYSWAEADYVGSQIGQDLLSLYRSLKFQPDPDEAAARRILATQSLLVPDKGLGKAKEPLPPFKAPHPETMP
jgi:tetratricopeptide (TPR) repeat protein